MKIKCFGIAKDITEQSTIQWTIEGQAMTVAALKQQLKEKYPGFKAVKSIMIAVNHNYALDTDMLSESDEIAIIPPVSGG